MTKEEKIRDEWDKLCLNSQLKTCMNTGYVVTYCTNGISDIIDNYIIDEEDIDWIDLSEDLTKWRPRSLQGIENNNGWVKIESENDLPEDLRSQYYCLTFKGTVVVSPLCADKYNFLKYYTHYQPQPIEKLKTPIY